MIVNVIETNGRKKIKLLINNNYYYFATSNNQTYMATFSSHMFPLKKIKEQEFLKEFEREETEPVCLRIRAVNSEPIDENDR